MPIFIEILLRRSNIYNKMEASGLGVLMPGEGKAYAGTDPILNKKRKTEEKLFNPLLP